MIEKIIEFCAYNKFIVFVIVTVAAVSGIIAFQNMPMDAIPDLSDTQVIVYSRWDRSPDIIEDQVTYPIVRALLGSPKVQTIRGFSDFGFSFVYVIFEDGTDIYWARSRVIEYLSKITSQLPEGVKTEIGPDASGVGWVFQYALVDYSGKHSLAELRSLQDWNLKYHLQSIPGVAEVAAVGGFVKQYQVLIDPNILATYKIPISKVVEAIKNGNNEVGGRLIEYAGTEYMVRAKGYVKSTTEIENIVVDADEETGTPILIKNIGKVQIGPEIRRGLADLDGIGDTVGGIVVMRHKENALNVIKRVKERLKELEPTLPEGVKIITTYDRSDLITKAIDTLTQALKEEMFVVCFIIFIFLLHIPSAIIPIFTLPLAVAISFIPFYATGLTTNIMSLGGIAIAIGAMVDASIVVVENAHKKLEWWEKEGRPGDFKAILVKAIQEVGRPSFYSLLVIAIAFMPIFALEAQEGRLFKPLAYTKNLAIVVAAVLAITLDPAIRLLFTRLNPYKFRPLWLSKIINAILIGKTHPEERHPISRFLFKIYKPAVNFVIKHKFFVIGCSLLLMLSTIPVYLKIGSEFMPPLNEGSILYMPTTPPGISVTDASQLLQVQDKILKSFPEVERVFGKTGRADTSTDPAPLSMMETTVILKPESEWRKKERWYSSWAPEFLKDILRHVWPDHITWDELIDEMDKKMKFPGAVNAWTMPIKNRIDMLSTGVRTPVGIKIFGNDLTKIEEIGKHIESVLWNIPGTRSVYAERVSGGYFLDITPKREELARYGISIEEFQMVIMSSLGGENITTTVEGRERYPVNVRYFTELRDDPEEIKRILIPTMSGAQIPLDQIAEVQIKLGPAMIRDENGLLSGYVYVDTSNKDIGGYVGTAKKAIGDILSKHPGYSIQWTGQYEYMERVYKRLGVVVPITVIIIFFLIYLNTRSLVKTLIVFLAVPFSLIGAVWLLYILDYNMSIAVWVGMIALLGIDAETGVFMLLYLDLAYDESVKNGKMKTFDDLKEAVIHGAVMRIRPKLMTVLVDLIGLLPVMWSMGTGSDLMRRIAAPIVGGMTTSFLLELLVYPAIYTIWKWNFEMKKGNASLMINK
ncbi:MAG: efflux RND transporter permease subunit [Planctomycetes bacterium]|nr:efflux RND transporter permease subunit [Planctomycetota bacterium]